MSGMQKERLAALYEVSSKLGTTLDLTELLNIVMDSVIQLTSAERGFLMLIDDYGELRTESARNFDKESIEGAKTSISRSVVRHAVTRGDPILTDNAQEDPRFASEESVVGLQLRSIMCAPLWARGRVIGAVYVDNRLLSGVFNEGDLELLVTFVNQAAVAIDNARLFEQTDKALARRVEELSIFQRIDRELNRSLDLHRALSLALEWSMQLTDADSGSVGLFQEISAEQVLNLSVFVGVGSGHNKPRLVPATHPVVEQVLKTQMYVHTPEVSAEESIDGTAAAVQLAVPIKKEGAVIGIITLESHLVTVFVDEDIEFVTRLADRAAVAIENSRLYEAVQAANEARARFTSVVTHELRIPLTSIRGYTDLLMSGMAGSLTDQQAELLTIVRRNTERMRVLISDLSDINRMESGRMKYEPSTFNLISVIEEVAADLSESIIQRQQTLEMNLPQTSVNVYADRIRISQVISNLVNNAHKYTQEGGSIKITVKPNGENARVTVEDTGIGIRSEDQAKLFQQFFRAEDQEVREQSGWGLGLSIVKMIVEQQGGDIEFESEFGKGSLFTFTVPLAQSEG